VTLAQWYEEHRTFEELNNIEINDLECCGVKEIDGLSKFDDDPEAAMSAFCLARTGYNHYHQDTSSISSSLQLNFAHILFTQAGNVTYGQQFARFIRANRLGSVVRSRIQVNPNSKNPLAAYIWTVDRLALKRWWAKQVRDLKRTIAKSEKADQAAAEAREQDLIDLYHASHVT
jgi:hypothetical protein